jgi:hypothetical protein
MTAFDVARWRLTAAAAGLVLALAAGAGPLGCKSDECSRSSDCRPGQACVRGDCIDVPGADADADADVGADADADADVRDDGPPEVPGDDRAPGPDADADADDVPDYPTGCTNELCNAYCDGIGLAPGECVDDSCFCRGVPDGGPGPDADGDGDAEPEGPAGCTSVSCNDWCAGVGLAPGECVDDSCHCLGLPDGGPDADADADGDADADDDEGVSDDDSAAWDCRRDDECDDGEECTIDYCAPRTHTCYFEPLPEGVPCSDGWFCNGLEVCSGGACVDGEPPCDVRGSPECQAVSCDEAAEDCLYENFPDGTACETTGFCAGPGQCTDGGCLHSGPYPCPPVAEDPCQMISCNEDARRCDTVPKFDGANCQDEVVCNGTETCLGGVCTSGAAFCDDGDPCTSDACVEDPIEPTCTHEAIPGCP